jgi:two-component system sensor histidine kinase KdpD
MMAAHRPDPDQLLRRIELQEACDRRGRLKIFLGYAPRVGKSFQMFDEGRRRLERGQDVVVGAVQSRGSEELASLLSRFEITSLNGILKRKPQVCLVDELAADDRWKDVQELLEHGITVLTAINLQYVAEYQDEIEKLTGKRAADSVPEDFIRSADEIVVVDAASQTRQLSTLREMALLLAAEVVESQLQRYMDANGIEESWGIQERILVCLTARSDARAMLQTAQYAAERFHGLLFAVYVTGRDLPREAQQALDQNLSLARKLGAEVQLLKGADPIDAIIKFARQQRVTQIYIGHTQQSSWRFWAANPVDRLIGAAEGIDVRIFPHGRTA